LYNYLFAKRQGGVFILRIEDTDRTRFVPGAVENLIDALRWAGITFDEGPGKEGGKGPYVQSERLSLYQDHARQLVENGHAYYAFDTPEELEAMRKEQERLKVPPRYDRRALHLTADEVRQKLSSGAPSVIRMKVPDGTIIAFDDVVRGHVEFAAEQIDDQVLLKSDGYPTYHLANVVDDHMMGISHVIRGEEWLSSTPKHVLLYRYFGWEQPVFAHLPLLLNPDKSKLSKRQGDVSVEDYRKNGYLPEALVNFVAFLGWNPGDDRELFLPEELVGEFSLDRVGKSGAVFNVEKLAWLNAQHLRRKTDPELLALIRDIQRLRGTDVNVPSDEYLRKVISVMKDRSVFAKDFLDQCVYFYAAPTDFDREAVKKRWTAASPDIVRALGEEFVAARCATTNDFETALIRVAERLGVKKGDCIHPLRLAVSGVSTGPGLYDILAILGVDETVARLKKAIERLHG
jgi:glutamyl-tRNA synthetase